MELLFCSPTGDLCVIISKTAMEIINQDIKRYLPFETGGILIGSYDPNLRLANVLYATSAPSDSQHSLFSFSRGIQGIREKLDCAYKEKLHYLGEWHSHPLNKATPSLVDLKQMNEFARTKELGCSCPILFIIGGDFGTPEYHVSLYRADKPYTKFFLY